MSLCCKTKINTPLILGV